MPLGKSEPEPLREGLCWLLLQSADLWRAALEEAEKCCGAEGLYEAAGGAAMYGSQRLLKAALS